MKIVTALYVFQAIATAALACFPPYGWATVGLGVSSVLWLACAVQEWKTRNRRNGL